MHLLHSNQRRRLPAGMYRKGTAVAELAILLPLILTLLLGLWEIARLVTVQQILSNAARETARQTATGGLQLTNVQTLAVQYLRAAGLKDYTSSASTVVSFKIVANLQSPAAGINTPSDPSTLQYLDEFTVTISIPTSDVLLYGWTIITNTSSHLSSTVTWMAIADQPPGTLSTPPTG